MPRRNTDIVIGDDPPSSPARPSHHNRVNPYARGAAHVHGTKKRTATEAALPSPPATAAKRKHYAARPVKANSEDELDTTPTKAGRSTRRRAAETPEPTTPTVRAPGGRGRTANKTGNSPALSHLSVHERSRSPTPLGRDQSLPPPSLLTRLSANERKLVEDDSESEAESELAPTTPKGRQLTPPRRTRSSAPIRDSPNNPFLPSGLTPPKHHRGVVVEPIEDRDTMTVVFRGVKTVVPNYLKHTNDERQLSPSHPDYSPTTEFKPRRLFESSLSPTPVTRRRLAATRGESPTRQPSLRTAKGPRPNVARRLFTVEIPVQESNQKDESTAIGHVGMGSKPVSGGGWTTSSSSSSSSVSASQGIHNIKAKALKAGIKQGAMSSSMVIAHAHGPPRGSVTRQDTYIPPQTRAAAAAAVRPAQSAASSVPSLLPRTSPRTRGGANSVSKPIRH